MNIFIYSFYEMQLMLFLKKVKKLFNYMGALIINFLS